jgi:IS1 family transposase
MKRWMCKNCRRTFSKFTGTVLYRMRIPRSEIVEIIKMCCRGNGIRDSSFIKERDKNTILSILSKLAKTCKKIGKKFFKNIPLKIVEFDEIFTKIKKRINEKCIWTSFEAVTKLWVSFQIGLRDHKTGRKLFRKVKKISQEIVAASSDGLLAYEELMRNFFRRTMYGQVIKVYEGRKLKKIKKRAVSKHSLKEIDEIFKEYGVGKGLNTSGVERLNKTMRSRTSNLIRKTERIAKKQSKLEEHLYIEQMFYNFVEIHTELGTTPAVAAGITDYPWTVEELLMFR